ncbi:MAG: FAD-binding oxidoreductase [Bryobacterales bacterium]|nr:FAD-binding oxidoreductase [Bryobacterales bacterium]MDE0622209.1 FAD-binding oxidoreductase [Bryobacterales bacterium]
MRDSIWNRTLPAKSRVALLSSDPLPPTADVAIIGAGLVGLCAALSLSRRGVRRLAVIDRTCVCGESTGSSAGGLWPAHECFSFASPEIVRRAAAQHAGLHEQFPCDYASSGLLELVADEDAALAAERADRTRAAGFDADLLAEAELAEREPRLRHHGPALHFPGDGSIHPLKLASGIAAWLRRRGACICLGEEVRDVSPDGPVITTGAGRISVGKVVFAAGAWTPLLTRMLGWSPPIRPLRGTLLATDGQPAETLRSIVVGRHFYYWQLASGPLAGGGSEEDVGFCEDLDDEVVGAIRQEWGELFPSLRQVAFTSGWTGFRPHCADMHPAIGPVPGQPDMFVSAGHFRKGILLAPLSGDLLADQMLEGASPEWARAFRPDRFPAGAVGR